MPLFKAVQIEIDSGKSTGRKEWYFAKNSKDAARQLLYTRKLKHSKCKLGPTGRVVANCGDGTSWVITRQKQTRKKKA